MRPATRLVLLIGWLGYALLPWYLPEGWDLARYPFGRAGTALALAEAVRRGRRTQAPLAADRASRHEPRRAGEIGIASLRGGTPAGEHRLMLLGEGERLEFTHVAESRAIFASGAVRAAMWLSAQPAGRYTMREMLGL